MKNSLMDVHNLLVATLEDLDDPDIMEDADKLEKITRLAKAKTDVVKNIIELNALQLEAAKYANHYDNTEGIEALPESLKPRKTLKLTGGAK